MIIITPKVGKISGKKTISAGFWIFLRKFHHRSLDSLSHHQIIESSYRQIIKSSHHQFITTSSGQHRQRIMADKGDNNNKSRRNVNGSCGPQAAATTKTSPMNMTKIAAPIGKWQRLCRPVIFRNLLRSRGDSAFYSREEEKK